jgi:hypothetical protein
MKLKKPTDENVQKQSETVEKNNLNKLIEKTRKQNKVLQKLLEKINAPEKPEK